MNSCARNISRHGTDIDFLFRKAIAEAAAGMAEAMS
jgi:hypothetical protein